MHSVLVMSGVHPTTAREHVTITYSEISATQIWTKAVSMCVVNISNAIYNDCSV